MRLAPRQTKVTLRFYAFVAIDSHGNYFTIAVDDLSDTIQVYGLLDQNFDSIIFEDDIRHFHDFAEENDITYKITNQEIDVLI